MLGYDSADELLCAADASASSTANPEDRVAIARRELKREGEMRNAEFMLRRRDGTLVMVVENARVIRDEHGVVIGYEGTITDITERKRAESAVFEEKEHAQVTLQSIGDAVITADADGRVEYLNPVAESTHRAGRPATPAAGRSRRVHSSSTKRRVEAVDEPDAALPARGARRRRRRAVACSSTAAGQEIAIQDSAAPIRDRSGRLIGVVMVFHDVSQERRLQRALVVPGEPRRAHRADQPARVRAARLTDGAAERARRHRRRRTC